MKIRALLSVWALVTYGSVLLWLAEVCENIGMYMFRKGKYDKSEAWLDRCIRLCERDGKVVDYVKRYLEVL